MPPLFPHQAVMFQSHTAAPPYNEVLDSFLTGYLWGSLLITLFLFTYFAISFCAWVLSAVLATIDKILDYARTYYYCSDASTNVERMAPIWLGKYATENLEQLARPNEITKVKCALHEYDTALQDAPLMGEILRSPLEYIMPISHADPTKESATPPVSS